MSHNFPPQFVPKPCLSLRRISNLAQNIVRAKLKDYTYPPQSTSPLTIMLQGHSRGCNYRNCKCCHAMSRKSRVTSSHSYKSYSTPTHTNCTTKNVVYLLKCTNCTANKQYVGQKCQTCRTQRQADTKLTQALHSTGTRL